MNRRPGKRKSKTSKVASPPPSPLLSPTPSEEIEVNVDVDPDEDSNHSSSFFFDDQISFTSEENGGSSGTANFGAPSVPLPPGFVTQKELLLRYRPPRRYDGQQIVRLPTTVTAPEALWNNNRYSKNTATSSDGDGDFDDPYVEICVNDVYNGSENGSEDGFEGTGGEDHYNYPYYGQDNDDDEDDINEVGLDDDGEDIPEEHCTEILNYLHNLVQQRLADMQPPGPQVERIERKREKMRLYYATETDDQRLKRLNKAREYKRQQKAKLEKVETAEQRLERLKKQRERQRRFYARETPEQRQRRLDKVRNYQKKRKQDRLRDAYGGVMPGEDGAYSDFVYSPPPNGESSEQ